MAKDPRLSTKWWVCNEDDAEQLALEFHGPKKPGAYRYEENHATIADVIVGLPKKQVLGFVDWALKQRLTAPEEEPFLFAHALDEWAKARGFGPYAVDVDQAPKEITI